MSVELRGPDVTGEACGGFNYRDRPARPAFAPIINDQTCADSWVYGSTPTGVPAGGGPGHYERAGGKAGLSRWGRRAIFASKLTRE